MAQLDALAQGALGGAGHVAFLLGEAGVGKTSLLRAFAERTTGAKVLRAACEDLSIPEPLGALHDLAQQTGLDPDALLAGAGDRLAAFQRLLASIDEVDGPKVLLVEDLHWADEATLDFLRFLGRRIRGRPILLVGTSRDGEAEGRPQLRRALGGVPPDDVTRISLQALSVEAVGRLVAESGSDPGEVHRLTGGNPFYVTELLRGDERDALQSVQDAVLTRIARAAPDVATALQTVSIFPRRAERDWVLAVSGVEEDALDAAVGAGLVEDDGTHLAFRHEIARRAVEATLRPAHRRRLNAALLAEMARSGRVSTARRLHHAGEAGAVAEIARLAPLAGREAMAAGANREAAEYLSVAVDLADPEDRAALAALLFDAGEACRLVGRLADAVSFFDRALKAADGDTALRGRALQRLSRVQWSSGRKVQARALGDAAIAVFEGPDAPDLAMALASRAQVAMSDYDMSLAMTLAQRAEGMARRLGLTDVVSHVLSTQSLADLFDSSRQNTLYEASIEAAIAANSPVNLVRCYANGGVVNFYLLRFREALALCDRAIATAYETDTTEQIEFHQGYRVHNLDRLGRWDTALAEARDVLSRPLESASPAIMLRLTAARIAIRRGQSDGAEEEPEIVALLGEEEDGRHVCDVAALVAERAWLGLGDAASARAALDRSLTFRLGPMLMEELLDWQRRLDPSGLPSDLDGVHPAYAASLAGDSSRAAELWHEASDPYRQALALAEGGAEDVPRAIAILDRLGADRVRDTVLSAARARGVAVDRPVTPRASTRANPAGLTKRQVEVLALLGEGLSNAQIGARLFISAKTVDHHVSAILGKLEAASRGEAVAQARAAGWLGT